MIWYLFDRCPNIDAVVRSEGEEIIQQVVKGVPFEEIRGLSYRRDGRIVHNENQALPSLDTSPFRTARCACTTTTTAAAASGSVITRSIRS